MANIKKGDLVQVITGAAQSRGGDRGKQGRVLEVLVDRNRVVVEGVNFVTKHVRVGQTQRGSKTGGIETHEAPSTSPTWPSSTPRPRSRPASATGSRSRRRTA
jgi:large subunit ribosomal protein L24